jgi:hypothetical protein
MDAMTTRKAFNTLLAMYQKRNLTLTERTALEMAIETFGAALGLKDWDWGN